MKHISLTIITAMFVVAACISCSKQTELAKNSTDWDYYDLKGKVKELHTNCYNAIIGENNAFTKGALRYTQVIYFSPEGKIEHVEFHNPSRGIFNKSEYTYSDNGLTVTDMTNDSITGITAYTYTEWNAQKEFIVYNSDGRILMHSERFYDDNHLLIKENNYSGDEVQSYKTDYVYNKNKLVESYIELLQSIELDPNTLELVKDKYKPFKSHTFKYDKAGRQIEACEYNATGFLTFKETDTYNKDGLVTSKEFEYEGGGSRTDYQYEAFDKQGNYTIRKQSSPLTSYGNVIDERTIIYYWESEK